MKMEKRAAMTDLRELERQVAWQSAIYDWFINGNLECIVAALRENIPMKDVEARFVAAIVARQVQHWGARGGPSIEKQSETHDRNRGVRPLFKRVLKIKQWRAKRHPEMRIDARSEAREYVSALFPGKLSPDAVKKIVEKPKPSLLFVMPGEAKAALVALFEQFKKKPE